MQSRVVLLPLLGGVLLAQDGGTSRLGREVAIERHLQDDEEFQVGIPDLIEFGRKLFTANWTVQEGGGRPLSKGTGDPLSDRNGSSCLSAEFQPRVSARGERLCGLPQRPVCRRRGRFCGQCLRTRTAVRRPYIQRK